MPAFLPHVRGRIVLIRWLDSNSPAALVQLRALIEQTHAPIGEPLVFAAIVPAEAEVLSTEQRERLAAFFDDLDAKLQAIHMLLLGRSLRQSIVRSVLVAVMLQSKHKGAKIAIDSSALQLATAVHELTGVDSTELLDSLRTTGLLRADELGR